MISVCVLIAAGGSYTFQKYNHPNYQSEAAQPLSNNITTLNNQLIRARQDYDKALNKQSKLVPLVEIAKYRAGILENLMRSNPAESKKYFLSETERNRMPASISQYLEKTETLSGTLGFIRGDDFINKKPFHQYFIANEKTTRDLFFTGNSDSHEQYLNVGASTSIRTTTLNKTSVPESTELSYGKQLNGNVSVSSTSKQLRVAVITYQFPDYMMPSIGNVDAIAKQLFYQQDSVADFFNISSYGKSTWIGPVSKSKGDIFGPFTVQDKPQRTNTVYNCNFENWEEQAIQQAKQFGFREENYDTVQFFIPDNPCNFAAGWAYLIHWDRPFVKSYVVVFGDKNDYFRFVSAHEFGHTLGILHANSLGCYTDATKTSRITYSSICDHFEYGDYYSVMGGYWLTRELTAPHREQLGWLGRDSIISPTQNGVYDIVPLELKQGLRAIKIPISSTGDEFSKKYIYVEYRTPIGLFDGMGEASLDSRSIYHLPGVSIKIVEDFGPFPESSLIYRNPRSLYSTFNNYNFEKQVFTPGQEATIHEAGLTIRVESTDPDKARVRVIFNPTDTKLEGFIETFIDPLPNVNKLQTNTPFQLRWNIVGRVSPDWQVQSGKFPVIHIKLMRNKNDPVQVYDWLNFVSQDTFSGRAWLTIPQTVPTNNNYYLRLEAVGNNNISDYIYFETSEFEIVPVPTPVPTPVPIPTVISAPTNVVGTPIATSPPRVTLTWNTDTNSDYVATNIYRKTKGVFSVTRKVGSSSLKTFEDGNDLTYRLSNQTTYTYCLSNSYVDGSESARTCIDVYVR